MYPPYWVSSKEGTFHIREVPFVRNLDAPVSSIVPLAAKTQYPLAVVDEHDVFRGIVTKASVLSSLSV